jgi:predicted Na+-dependent transporter
MNTNQKIEDILQSMDKMHRPVLSPFFTAKVVNKIFEEKDNVIFSVKKPLLIISFSILLLVMNIAIFYKSNRNQFSDNKASQKSMYEFAKEYNLNSISINYYNELPKRENLLPNRDAY